MLLQHEIAHVQEAADRVRITRIAHMVVDQPCNIVLRLLEVSVTSLDIMRDDSSALHSSDNA